MRKISFLILVALMSACSQATHMAINPPNEVASVQPPPVQKASRPICEYDPTNYRLNGRLLSFYLKGAGSLGAGIDLVSGVLSFLGFKAEWTTFRMNSYAEMFNAYEMDTPAVWNEDGVQKSEIKFNLEATIQGLNTGVSNSSKIIFEEMVASAFLKNLKALDKVFKQRSQIWETSIFAASSNGTYVIPVGEAVGLKVGDRLNIYKGDFQWTGKPCESTRYFANPEGAEWIAEAEVASNSAGLQNIAILKIIKKKENAVIERADIVRFKEFVVSTEPQIEKKRSAYKFVVRVDKVDQMDIRLEDGRKIEMTDVLKSLIEKTMNKKFENYYIKKSSPFANDFVDASAIELYRAKELFKDTLPKDQSRGRLVPKSSSLDL